MNDNAECAYKMISKSEIIITIYCNINLHITLQRVLLTFMLAPELPIDENRFLCF